MSIFIWYSFFLENNTQQPNHILFLQIQPQFRHQICFLSLFFRLFLLKMKKNTLLLLWWILHRLVYFWRCLKFSSLIWLTQIWDYSFFEHHFFSFFWQSCGCGQIIVQKGRPWNSKTFSYLPSSWRDLLSALFKLRWSCLFPLFCFCRRPPCTPSALQCPKSQLLPLLSTPWCSLWRTTASSNDSNRNTSSGKTCLTPLCRGFCPQIESSLQCWTVICQAPELGILILG